MTFSLWHFVFNQFDGCELLFYSDTYQWYFTENATCADIIIEYLELYYISVLFAFACLLDLYTLISLIRHLKVVARDRPFSKNDVRFFLQSCITGFVFVGVTFCFHLGYQVFDENDKLGQFLVSTFAWECTHSLDGIIVVLFNKELRRIFTAPRQFFANRIHSQQHSAGKENLCRHGNK
ncbi:hypothetical protein WR25_24187 [Diploscapter pachys]|uniref:7TM GPCR serpentine receptor class x (Srx) domain-containing protein n=1 Tax=Diploscapter pachys TaxID=2018661 RepID=A0A2A2KZD5_9BILA|nr:hypothetical protein WR25_24187 [Diploscapter pachys]